MSAKRGLEVAAVLDAAQVPAGAVRAGDELALAQRLVGDDLAREADRAERAGVGAERLPGSPPPSPAGSRRRARRELRLLEPVVAADEREHDRAVVLRRPASPSTSRRRRSRASSASASIVVTPGVSTSSGASSRVRELGRARDAPRDLEVGRVVAALAGDERVLARAGRARGSRCDSLPPIIPRLRLHGVHLEPAALEDPVVRAAAGAGSCGRAPPRRGRTSRRPS